MPKRPIKHVVLKRGATWHLPVTLRQRGADWSLATYLIHIRATPDAADALAIIQPIPSEPSVDESGRSVVTLTNTLASEFTAELPLGTLYADLLVVRPAPDGVQFPCEWRIDNVIQITR